MSYSIDSEAAGQGGPEQWWIEEEPRISAALPYTLGSRIVLVLVNLLLVPATGSLLYVLYTNAPPQRPQWRIVYYLFAECVLMFLIICTLSLMWAILQPRWIARVFDGLYAKFFMVVFFSFLAAWLSMVLTR